MSRRILVVEADPANRELMAYLLSAFGHTVMEASDAETAADYARRTAPELMLCAVALDDFDRCDALRRLRADDAFARVPFVAVTTAVMAGDRDRVLAAGFDGYITMPIDPATFVSDVERFLEAKAEHGDDPRR
jgi:two-component system cell cycle response regulator